MSQLECVVVTPEKTTLSQTADSVVLPMFDGEMGILKGHSPLVGRLAYGALRLRTGNAVQQYYVDGGFVQVVKNRVTVLTDRMIPLDQLSVEQARKGLEEALKLPATSPDKMQLRDRSISQMRAQLHLASKAK